MSNGFHHTNKTTATARVKQAIVGVNKYFGGQASLPLGGQPFTPATLVALMQSFVDLDASLTASKSKTTDLVSQFRTLGAQINALLLVLRGYVVGIYGPQAAQILGDFGFAPTKATKPTVAVKAVALEKGAATRQARHTLGKEQKKAIKGTVSGEPAPLPAVVATSGTQAKS